MKKFKEKPKMGNPKEKPTSALLPKQAARMMKEKYIKHLDQRKREADGSPRQAPEQVERAGRWAADELTGRTMEQGRKLAKKKYAAARVETQPGPEPVPHGADSPPCQPGDPLTSAAPASPPKEHPAAEHSLVAPKQRPQVEQRANPIKERRTVEGRATQNQSRAHNTTHPPRTGQAQRPSTVHPLRERPTAQDFKERPDAHMPKGGPGTSPRRTSAAPNHLEAVPPRIKTQKTLKERPRLELHSRGCSINPGPGAGSNMFTSKKSSPAFKTRRGLFQSGARGRMRPAPPAVRAAKAAQRQAQRKLLAQTKRTAKGAGAVLRRAIQAVAKAAAAVTGAVSAVVGGCVLLVALVVIIVIAAVANSPFGLFFAQEPNAPDAVSVSQAVGSVNMAYSAKLEQLQAGDYDSIDIQGTAPDWPDVLAVFAVKVAGADVDGMDVATLDADRVAKLTAVFWDMTALTSTVETIPHPDSSPEDDVDDSWTERILHITVTPKTANDMRAAYGFTAYQNSALDELLADRAALAALAGSLTITSADVLDILRNLPDDLSPERRAVVEKALSLVGKVNYFWGGKSRAIGWDNRWGTLQKVTSPGSSTTGTYLPYGLDCSGFLDWALRNAGLHSDGHWYIGRNLTAVSLADAMPGDFALYPDASHVGMIVGRNETRKLLVCHCSYGMNNVVVTEFVSSGFTAVGRQTFTLR